MFDDPIVNEIRETRERIAAEHHYDLYKLFTHWRKLEENHQDRLVKNTEDSKNLLIKENQ